MLIKHFDDFVLKTANLHKENPFKCRAVLKYRPTEKETSLKVTDDKQVFNF
ncbi:hypothetical protein A3Q56_00304 [Intoshia linei]|uniref:Signal recognition particle 9 kDa protein n=1 Tax=Intoshia linei TaxID=1819745 RepID=A0A177BCI5_9BILA|nr:hypothetical protein A3Q56_00304 [Intoshia linei]